MDKFKVGQKVKVKDGAVPAEFRGTVQVIEAPKVDGLYKLVGSTSSGGPIRAVEEALEPVIDKDEEAFVQFMQKIVKKQTEKA